MAEMTTAFDTNGAVERRPEPKPLPQVIRISQYVTPNGMRLLKAATGRTLDSMQDDEADKLQAIIFLSLVHAGYRPTWDEAGDVAADGSEEPPDPTNVGTSPTSLPSAATGG